MKNDERRAALATARRKVVEYADLADKVDAGVNHQTFLYYRDLALMWSAVAAAMKVGDATGPDSTDGLSTEWITR